MSSRASFEELMEFANRIREAGGGNPLDALMPAIPQDSSQCLIARNLNFNCEVNGSDVQPGHWCMWVDDRATRDKIAATLNLPTEDRSARKAMLPYIEASELEAFDLATTVTDDGKIVI
jgi:hypothetical protein